MDQSEASKLLESIKTARVGSTLYVYDTSTESMVEATITKILLSGGPSRVYTDGSREFYRDEVIIDNTKTGSDMYTWDKTGNKVKHNRCRYIVTKDGKMSREITRTLFKPF